MNCAANVPSTETHRGRLNGCCPCSEQEFPTSCSRSPLGLDWRVCSVLGRSMPTAFRPVFSALRSSRRASVWFDRPGQRVGDVARCAHEPTATREPPPVQTTLMRSARHWVLQLPLRSPAKRTAVRQDWHLRSPPMSSSLAQRPTGRPRDSWSAQWLTRRFSTPPRYSLSSRWRPTCTASRSTGRNCARGAGYQARECTSRSAMGCQRESARRKTGTPLPAAPASSTTPWRPSLAPAATECVMGCHAAVA